MEEIFKKIKGLRHEIIDMNDYFKDADYELWMTYCDLTCCINNLYIQLNKESGGVYDVCSK